MALLPLKIPPGIERNNTPFETPDRWWDMDQIRWVSGSMLPIGGWNKLTGTPLDSRPRAFNVWRNNVNARIVLVGTDDKLWVDDGDEYVDITPAAFVGPGAVDAGGGYGTGPYGEEAFGTPRALPSPVFSPYGYWSFGQWGEDVILTANTDGRLFYYTQSTLTTAPALIAAAPTGNNAVIVTAERHAMTVGSDADPRQIAWSSAEDYTDWDFASVTNTAGRINLTTRSPLLKAFKVAEGTLVLSYTDVFLIRYLGLPYVYGGTDPISDTALFNPSSVATFGGKAVWPSRLGFQLYAGGYVQPLPCPVIGDILNGQDDDIRMDPAWGPFLFHGAHNGRYPEIWWFYPSVGQTDCNRYVCWNYEENLWAWGALARSAMAPADAYQYPYMGSPAGDIYEHEFGWLDNGATRVGTMFAETGDLTLAGGTSAELQQLRIANGNGYNAIEATILGKYTPEGTEYTEGPFEGRDDGYMDARASYPHMRLRFTNAIDGPFAVGTVYVDAVSGGDQR